MGLLSVLNWQEIHGEELLMRNKNKDLRREELRHCVLWKGELGVDAVKERDLCLSSHNWWHSGHILGLKTRKDCWTHEKTGKKTIPQFPWSAEGGGLVSRKMPNFALSTCPGVKLVPSHTDHPSCPCFAPSSVAVQKIIKYKADIGYSTIFLDQSCQA